MKFVEIQSERLIYRKFKYGDFLFVRDWLGNAENMRYRRGILNEAEVGDYLNWAITNAEAEECENFEYAVERKEDGLLIGSASLMRITSEPEIGWTVHRDFWRHGYGTEMGGAMLRLGFDMLGLRRITAGCIAENQGSYKIMEKLGMRREAHFVKAQQGNSALDHEWYDRYEYAILREEWEALKNK